MLISGLKVPYWCVSKVDHFEWEKNNAKFLKFVILLIFRNSRWWEKVGKLSQFEVLLNKMETPPWGGGGVSEISGNKEKNAEISGNKEKPPKLGAIKKNRRIKDARRRREF